MSLPIYQQQDTVFQPITREIINITQAVEPTGRIAFTITTSVPHQYYNGIIVTLKIPLGWEPQALDGRTGTVFIIQQPNEFTMYFDDIKTLVEPFTVASLYPQNAQVAQVVPNGEINETAKNAFRNALPY